MVAAVLAAMVKGHDGGERVPRVVGALSPAGCRQVENIFFKGLQAAVTFVIIIVVMVGFAFYFRRVWERRHNVASSATDASSTSPSLPISP